MYFDNLRLDTQSNNPYADAANNIWKFDCCSWETPMWPDFFRLTQNTNYPVAAGTEPFGWVVPSGSAQNKQVLDWYGPDDFTRGFVRQCCQQSGSTPFEFRLDLPNGNYKVYLVAAPDDWSGFATEAWTVSLQGSVVYSFTAPDSGTFYSDSFYFRGSMKTTP